MYQSFSCVETFFCNDHSSEAAGSSRASQFFNATWQRVTHAHSSGMADECSNFNFGNHWVMNAYTDVGIDLLFCFV